MLVVVIVTAARPVLKEDAVMGVEDDDDDELTEKRDEDDYEDYDEMMDFDADVEKVKKGRKNSLTLRRIQLVDSRIQAYEPEGGGGLQPPESVLLS